VETCRRRGGGSVDVAERVSPGQRTQWADGRRRARWVSGGGVWARWAVAA
jgi:hypothetical protein